MSETQVMGEEYKKTLEYYTEKIQREYNNENLANALQTATPADIVNDHYMKSKKQSFPECKETLESLQEEVRELQDNEQEAYDWTKYFEEQKNGKKFQPRWLANDIEEDHTFKKVKDSEELFVFVDGYYQEKGHQLIKQEAEKRLQDEYRERRVREVISIIESRNYIKRNNFRPPERKINLKNGVYDLQKEELHEHSPEYYFTHKIQTRYDINKECPKINEFLQDIVKTEEEVKTLREIAGYLLLPDYPIPKAFMLLGKGNNGKSRYLDLLRNLIGQQNVVEKGLQDLDGRFGTNELQGKIGCIDDDLSSTKINEDAAGTMKKLTGGSRIGAEVKYGGHYNFYNYAKLVFSANELPRTTDDTDGFFRRWIVVEFPYKFVENPNPDKELEKKGKPKKQLMEEITDQDELEGFLWWAIEALKDVLANDEFTHAPDTNEAREKWREYSIPLVKFIQTYVKQGTTRTQAEREADDTAKISDYTYDYVRKDFLEELIGDYCEARSHSRPSKKAITKELEKEFYVGSKSRTRQEPEENRVPVYSGIKLLYPNPEKCPGVQTYFDTFTRTYTGTRVESSQQSVDIRTDSSSNQDLEKGGDDGDNTKNRLRKVKEAFEHLDSDSEGFYVDDVIDHVVRNNKLTVDEVEEAISKLKKKGELHEPNAGEIALL